MIVASASDNNGIALTFGLTSAAAVVCLIVATAVGGSTSSRPDEAELAARVDDLARGLVEAGAPESAVRELVREALNLGRARRTAPQSTAPNRSAPDGEAGAGVHGGRTPSPSGGTFT